MLKEFEILRQKILIYIFIIFFFAGCCPKPVRPAENAEVPFNSIGHEVALYLPNRIFDLLDIFRVRVRLGPGISVGVRASKHVQFF